MLNKATNRSNARRATGSHMQNTLPRLLDDFVWGTSEHQPPGMTFCTHVPGFPESAAGRRQHWQQTQPSEATDQVFKNVVACTTSTCRVTLTDWKTWLLGCHTEGLCADCMAERLKLFTISPLHLHCGGLTSYAPDKEPHCGDCPACSSL